MPCIPFQTKDGLRGIACVRGGRKRCSLCKNAWASLECDYPTPARKSGTCDKPLCRGCAVHVGDNQDFCRTHPPDTPPGPAQKVLEL